jgi:hypothetical protein
MTRKISRGLSSGESRGERCIPASLRSRCVLEDIVLQDTHSRMHTGKGQGQGVGGRGERRNPEMRKAMKRGRNAATQRSFGNGCTRAQP